MHHTVTVKEAARLTSLSRRQLTYAARTGKISTCKLPGRTGAYLFDLEEVRRYTELTEASA